MIQFGTHYRAAVHESERDAIRLFYTDVFHCEMHSSEGVTRNIPDNIDLFIFADGNCFGVEYFSDDTRLLTIEEHRSACWMEVKTNDVAELKERCLTNGAREITDYWDKDHFYFHAPGGQVYRIIGIDEK